MEEARITGTLQTMEPAHQALQAVETADTATEMLRLGKYLWEAKGTTAAKAEANTTQAAEVGPILKELTQPQFLTEEREKPLIYLDSYLILEEAAEAPATHKLQAETAVLVGVELELLEPLTEELAGNGIMAKTVTTEE